MSRTLALAFVALLPSVAHAQSVDDLLKQHLTAIGGQASVDAIKTVRFTGHFDSGGMSLPLTVQLVVGKATRTDVSALGMQLITAYRDADALGWTVNPLQGISTPTTQPPAELRNASASLGVSPLLRQVQLGGAVSVVGDVVVEGVATHELKVTAKSGTVTHFFLIAADGLLLKSATEAEMAGARVQVETWFSDYTEVSGVRFARVQTHKVGEVVADTTTFTQVEVNVPIDDAVFSLPR